MDPLNSLEEPVDPTVHDTNETLLWRGVLLQAMVDATEPDTIVDVSTIWARDQARAWIYSTSASVVLDLDTVCDLAAVNPFLFRSAAKRCIETGTRIHRTLLTSALKFPEPPR